MFVVCFLPLCILAFCLAAPWITINISLSCFVAVLVVGFHYLFNLSLTFFVCFLCFCLFGLREFCLLLVVFLFVFFVNVVLGFVVVAPKQK